jgi:hypothetical protein
MKLRVQGNSLRLRISPSEMARLLDAGRIEETIVFGPEPDAKLTYALEHAASDQCLSIRYRLQEVTVLLSSAEARKWAAGEQVGISDEVSAGSARLSLLVEKDFACLDRKGREKEDTFPNPKGGAAC